MRNNLYTWKYENIAEKVKTVLEKNGFEVYIAKDKTELLEKVDNILPKNAVV
ncbi:MAG: LUD domain-containing protein, partial [Fervidobacterium pennivorans]